MEMDIPYNLKGVREWIRTDRRVLTQAHAVNIFEKIMLACPIKRIPRVSAMLFEYPHGTSSETQRAHFLSTIDATLFHIEAENHAHCAVLVLVRLKGKYRDIFRLVYEEYLPRFGI